MSAMSDYLENKLIDLIFRGQAFTAPTTLSFALFTAAPSDSGGGTEVSGGSYARQNVTASLANFAGTQSAGSTVASSGTGGQTSNNAAITWSVAPTANWGTVTSIGVFDGSNLLCWSTLTANRIINSGDAAPSFAIGAFTFTFA